ncbi:MAG TPA: hypothetical protein VMS21_06625 [Methylomirabilota bacterium]|nr:hypothetical protein [Methylomirabilota bacterium]
MRRSKHAIPLGAVLALGLTFTNTDGVMAAAPFPIEILDQKAQFPNALPTDFNTYAEAVAISGDRAVASEGNRADLFVQEDGAWRYEGSLFGGIRNVALDGDTLVLGTIGSTARGVPDSADVYVRGAEPGLNAWTIVDRSTFERSVSYAMDVPPEVDEEARANGWRYRIHARFIDDFGSSFSMSFLYGDGTTRHGVYFDLNTAGDLVAGLFGATPVEHVLTTDQVGARDYHVHELVYDPDTQMATYYFDGEAIHSWAGQNQANDGIYWGWGSTAGMGAMSVHEAHFEILGTGTVVARYNAGTEGNPVIAPDPVDQGWTLEGTPQLDSPVAPQSPDPITVWQLQASLTDDTSSATDQFGSSLALDGDTLVVGAWRDDEGGTDTGSAYVFVRDGTDWSLQQKLAPSVRASSDYFGMAVDVDEDTIIVGAPHRNSSSGNTFPGRAFVFVRNGGVWTEQSLLTALDGAGRDAFGSAVAVDGDRALVGAPWDNSFDGSAYVFNRSEAFWLESGKLTGDGGQFGASLDLKGETTIVGGSSDGSHYIFSRSSNGQWVEVDSHQHDHSFNPGVGGVAYDGQNFMVGVFEFSGSVGFSFIYGPDYSNTTGLQEYARKLLYYPDAGTAEHPFDPNQTAFRYRHLLYGEEDSDLRARVEVLPELYGQAERDLAAAVQGELLKGLELNPDDADLGNLLLDIYYDRTVVEGLLAKEVEAEAERARFGLIPQGGFLIDDEIPLRSQVLESNRTVLNAYFPLLSDGLGLAIDPPIGFQLFQDLVPTRGLMAATYTNEAGMNVPVTGEPMLFSGYKDLVLLFELLRDHGRAAETLARLLIARGEPDDITRAAEVIADAQRLVFLQGNLLKNLFDDLPPEGDPSGLAEAMGGWRQRLNALASLQPLLSSGDNVLGFADDFMMYVQQFSGQTQNFFDSYDALKARLDPEDGSNPLGHALEELQQAVVSYADYRGFQDQLAAQFNNSSITYTDRLRDIVGVFPSDPRYSDNPTNNAGSELDLQYRSIELARLQIKRNQVEIGNLNQQIRIELNKAESLSNVMVNFGSRQSRLTEQIGHINATQAGADALADALSPEKLLTGRIFGYILNAGVQAGGEVMKAEREGQKEELAALEQATITGIESDATVKTLALGLKTLAVDSQEAAALLRQEMNRLVALYREKEDLEQKLAGQQQSLAYRYFADPIHRLTAQSNMTDANLAFEEARKWVFFLVRALEYKWNTPFRNFEYPSGSGRRWSASTLFKLRNAAELEQMTLAMDTYESQIQLPKDDYFDWFSVRDDFFGYRLTNRVGEAQVYADPISGEPVGAIEAFRSRLRQMQDASGTIRLEFSTVREIPGGTFFRGPRFSATGQVLSRGLFLDKINWLKINLPGDHTLGRSQLSGELSYGGSSFIRNFDVGIPDPDRADRIRDELTAFSTRFWFFHAPSGTWRFNEALSSPVTMQLNADPRTPPTVQEIEVFKERSVAASGWVLRIQTSDLGQPVLDLDELDDVELYFYHYAITRQ